ncbi:MAG: hypothetical protein RIS36_64 [Pseudomonadota bacterium]|jgi:hypothetical protein
MAYLPRGESELAIFSRFSTAFSHVVRGDLSVITNEVSYLTTTMPSEELGRVRNRCSQIAATVSKIAGVSGEMAPTLFGVAQVAAIFGARLDSSPAEKISLDRGKIERLVSSIREIFGDTQTLWTAEWSTEHGLSLCLKIPSSQGQIRRYTSWSSFAAGELGERAVIGAVVADLIMRAHDWRLGIELDERCISCGVFIPAVTAVAHERRCA